MQLKADARALYGSDPSFQRMFDATADICALTHCEPNKPDSTLGSTLADCLPRVGAHWARRPRSRYPDR